MVRRLTEHINSQYIEAANRLTSKKARRKIVAYVESYDDVFFWRSVLGRFEDSTRYFEIMLPTRERHLDRGKKAAIANMLHGVGRDLIACVDADYDYLLQGASPNSQQLLSSPYIFHTYVYSIENYQCYAPGLHDTCVMVTLNDHKMFDFERYLADYSRAIYPLFVWNIWCYTTPNYIHFTMTDFMRVIEPGHVKLREVRNVLRCIKVKVDHKVNQLYKEFPQFEDDREHLEERLAQLGVTPDNAYLYIQGHHIFNKVVVPVVQKVCDALIQEREREIKSQALHKAQENTELSCYDNSVEQVIPMLKKNTYYQNSDAFRRILRDVERFLSDASDRSL